MKSVFYVGAALMLGASVYGFVDYEKNRNRPEFIDLYKDKKEMPEPVVLTNDDPVKVAPVPVTAETDKSVAVAKKAKAIRKKIARGTRVFSFKEFSRAPLKEMPAKKEVEKKSSEEKKEQ